MSFGLINLGSALNTLDSTQQSLLTATSQLSSGNELVNGSINPSGLAIYNALEAQANGFDTGAQNAQNALNAINVAQGALSNTTSALQQLNTLAIQANNGFLSPADQQILQTQANQLVQQINTNATSVNFNGQPLLTGQFSGTTPATPATATIPTNNTLGNGGNVVTNATATAGSVGGTIQVQIVGTGPGAAAAQITFTNTATGQVTVVGTVGANSTTAVNGTNVTVGNFTTNDIGANATVQVQAATAGSSNPTLNVQTGAAQGATVQVTLPNATAAGLGLQNINLTSAANATNAQGQINAALQNAITASANLGAQTNSIATDLDNDNVASLNLTASASAIGSSNTASLASELNSLLLKQQISIDTINSANNFYGYLNRFLNVAA